MHANEASGQLVCDLRLRLRRVPRSIAPNRRVLYAIRPPRAEDAAAIWNLADTAGTLDTNSPYAYVLLCTDFSTTGAVAEVAGKIIQFSLGYCSPQRPEVFFVWQIAVRPSHQGMGIASAIRCYALERVQRQGVRYLETTITPSNQASRRLFRTLACRARVELSETPAFSCELFPQRAHEEEVRVRIDPLVPD